MTGSDLRGLLLGVLTDGGLRAALLDQGVAATAEWGFDLTESQRTGLERNIEALRRGPMSPERRRARDAAATMSLAASRAKAPPGPGDAPAVAFVVMPHADVRFAALGVSLLQSACRNAGIDSDVIYANLDWADAVGHASYYRVGVTSPTTSLAGEWVFSQLLDGPDAAGTTEAYLDEVLMADHADYFKFNLLFCMGEMRATSGDFVRRLAEDPAWDRYAVVGFTTTFQQNAASLALAGALKRSHPQLTTVFGGANCEGPMGWSLLRNYPDLDFVFQGEAEVVFPRFVKDLVAAGGRKDFVADDAGWRAASTGLPDGRALIRCRPVDTMEQVPVPTYESFYARLAMTDDGAATPSTSQTAIPFETSRGCWWGEKLHCTFCGLNGQSMAFRSKDPDRALEELRHLVSTYGDPARVAQILVVDNILDYHYLDTFIPRLAESDLDVSLYYEVKANLRQDQLIALAAAGVRQLQPGIESLSNRVLKLMRKGTTRLRNVQLLKWCVESGIQPHWNYLHGFPGEQDGDYLDLPELCSLLTHLPPPEGVGPARADRFSPFFMTPDDLGIRELRREKAYDVVYAGITPDDRTDIAYYFKIVPQEPTAGQEAVAALRRAVESWRAAHPSSTLTARWDVDHLVVLDGRGEGRVEPSRIELDDVQSAVLLSIDKAQVMTTVASQVQRSSSGTDVERTLATLVEMGLAIRDGDGYLGLPVLDRASLPRGEAREARRTPSELHLVSPSLT